MKRGELSMEVIIIAAIALLVLVILTVLIIRSGGELSKECTNAGGTCQPSCGTGTVQSPHGGCGQGEVCCVSLNPS